MADPINDVADDWQLAPLLGLADVFVGHVGIFFFAIKSQKVKSLEPVIFSAFGSWVNGNNFGVSYDTFKNAMTGKYLAFANVTIVTPFSINMLHSSLGYYTSTNIGITNASFGRSYLEAGHNCTKFFTSSATSGLAGSGTGTVSMAGIWYSYKLSGL